MGMICFHGSEPNRHRSSDPTCTCGCHGPVATKVIEHHKETIKEVPAKGADLSKYTVAKKQEIGHLTIVWVHYHEVQPYGGMKLMLYRTKELDEAEKQGRIDPHFLPWHPSPIARFEPTDLGLAMAIELAKILSKKED